MLEKNARPYFFILLIISMNICNFGCQSSSNKEFVEIFDGETLDGWKGDANYWHVENGCLVGAVTPETILKSNTFIVWQGGQPQDFELKLEYRISESGNSGINYRSNYLEDNSYALRGYQCDIMARIDLQGRITKKKNVLH